MAADEDRGGFFNSEVRFIAREGIEYAVAVDGFAGAEGEYILSWSLGSTADWLTIILQEPQSQMVRLRTVVYRRS